MSIVSGQEAVVDVMMVLHNPDGQVLFGLRAAHLHAGGQYNLPSGKVEAGEDAVSAVIRETREETGVSVPSADLLALGVVHTAGSPGPRVAIVFAAAHDPIRHGLVVNAEPDKCDSLVWADPAIPPQPLESYNAAALGLFVHPGPPLIIHGWPRPVHRMRLRRRWFDLLAAGRKTVELRLHDHRRAAVQPGDMIEFTCPDTGRSQTAHVRQTRRYPTFAAALNDVALADVAGMDAQRAAVETELRGIYSDADERHHGVVAITVRSVGAPSAPG